MTSLAGLTRGGSLQARLEKGDRDNPTVLNVGSTFTMADIAAGRVWLVHLGQHPVTIPRSQQQEQAVFQLYGG